MIELSSAAYIRDSTGYPFLLVFVDGEPTRIFYEQKFLDQDIVLLDGQWVDRADPIVLPADEKDARGELTLRGFVRDKRLAVLVREYVRACDGDFQAGPVQIPEVPGEAG